MLKNGDWISTFAEVVWTLDCALALWAILKYGPDLPRTEGGHGKRETVKCQPDFYSTR